MTAITQISSQLFTIHDKQRNEYTKQNYINVHRYNIKTNNHIKNQPFKSLTLPADIIQFNFF